MQKRGVSTRSRFKVERFYDRYGHDRKFATLNDAMDFAEQVSKQGDHDYLVCNGNDPWRMYHAGRWYVLRQQDRK